MSAGNLAVKVMPWRDRLQGLVLALTVAFAASAAASWLGGPLLIYALAIGLALNFLGDLPISRPGLDACTRDLLRVGVALLGMRITLFEAVALGWGTACLMVLAVVSTVGLGAWLSRRFRRPLHEGLVSGAACGICGASAALAVAAVMPRSEANERFTVVAVAGVTVLSTAVMVIYPIILHWVGANSLGSSVFLGGSIHDVAQVVAAASMMDEPEGTSLAQTATLVKLMRVALLLPVVLALTLLLRPRDIGSRVDADVAPRQALVPGFLLAFVGFMLLASTGWLSPQTVDGALQISRILLAMAVAAVGMKTRLQDLRAIGWVPLAMLLLESIWVAVVVGIGALCISTTICQ